MQDALMLTSKSESAADEMVDTDDPMITKKMNYILRKVMKEDSGTWKAIDYLRELKSVNTGLDFRVAYDSGGAPEGILWMTKATRKILLNMVILYLLICKKGNITEWGFLFVPHFVKMVRIMLLQSLKV